MPSSSVPPPPPLPRPTVSSANQRSAPTPPSVPPNGPAGALLLELLTANGYPFKDHWSYFLGSRGNADVGVVVHATGDVAHGFRLEAKRAFDLGGPGNAPNKRTPLQWLDARHFDEQAMLNHGVLAFDAEPVGAWEESVHKVRAPGKTLNTVGEEGAPGKKVTQKNCQSWIVESAEQLVADGMLSPDVAAYLRALEQ
ncbi:hypothetical protein CCM_09277 [Cordyceps militaris CM01]|uniref:Uncharacterized protein n=1 Tax=Cordyceps militaris (strain CM01) TaxID=983644 RepID=G3JTY7_CORMM|nr:uncharacterized protein CCM_09277 [Cordyceps militaris CM01]EGX88141.1 hypothetical protein CCM_09277 [Cordyceps militaris CM01]